ncbi:MAG: hypothetical protein OSJ70_05915 [Bacilli bacterium]|nr:hypothetical protein [Bacilli bacterium]
MNNNEFNNSNVNNGNGNNTNAFNNNMNNQTDTMLNRERDNIVAATIDANAAIDEKKALDVNNQIKHKKTNKFVIFLAVLFALVVIIAAGYGIVKLTNKAMTYGDETTTTSTTTKQSEKSKLLSYLNDETKIRKFQSDNYILVLCPSGIDLTVANRKYYVLLNISDNGLLNAKYGAYTLNEGVLKLDNQEMPIGDNGITYNNESLKIFDTEMKYYQYKDSTRSYLLFINGTLKNEQYFFLESATTTNVKIGTYKETIDSITLNDNRVFTKVNNDVTYNNYTLKMYS